MYRSLRILLVEDNPGDARLLEEHLRDAGAENVLECVGRLDAARSWLALQHPDVILLDLSLPDVQGIETVRGALEAAPGVPIVVLTGLDDEELAIQAVQAGAQDYLVKGQVGPVVLSHAIRYAIERKRAETERDGLLAREREARSAAETAVRSRDRVLQVLSHDLGNHFAAIQLYAGMLLRALPDEHSWVRPREWAAGIQDATGHLQEMRENILDAIQIEAGRLSLMPRPLDARGLLESVREQLLPLAEEKELALHLATAAELPPLNGDRQRLLQALGNLLGNAIKFTPVRGEIWLHAERHEEGLRISVADTGPGIAPEHQAQIFESFWKTLAGNSGGTGLGLGIARGIVETHGGRLWVESEVGRGTTFSLTLPAAPTVQLQETQRLPHATGGSVASSPSGPRLMEGAAQPPP